MFIHRLWYRIALLLLIRFLFETPLYGESAAYERLRQEAFLRGGNAIAAALTSRGYEEKATVVFSERIPTPSPRPVPGPQGPADKGMSKLLWTGLIAGFAASGVLVYHFAAGPGASVRNCSTCQ
jgi:hypothetical protein